MKRSEFAGISLIFAAALLFRLFLAFRVPALDYDAYFHLRQVSHILQTGFPVFNGLSFSPHYFIPGFDYLLSLFAAFLDPVLVLKIIPNLFASSFVIIAFLIAKKITNNAAAALFSAALAGFLPVFVSQTFNSASPFSLVIPLMFFILYAFLRVNERLYAYLFLAFSIVLMLIHPAALLLVASLVLYFAISKLENVPRYAEEIEVILSSGLLVTWTTFLLYKQPLLTQGLAALRQNLPPELFRTSFANVSVLGVMYNIGILAAVAGLIVIYRFVLRQRQREIYILMSPALAMLLLLGLGMVSSDSAVMVLGASFAVLFAPFFVVLQSFLKKTHLDRYPALLPVVLALLFLATAVFPSYTLAASSKNSPSPEDIAAMEWLAANTPADAVVLAAVAEGHVVTTLAQRKNVIDSIFVFSGDVNQRFADVQAIYTTQFETQAVQLLSLYEVDYLFLSSEMSRSLGVDSLSYLEDEKCFSPVYNGAAQIYESLCEVS